jgi:hypothetical protein
VDSSGNALLEALTQWSAQWHLEIASRGYRYDPQRQSAVAYFPAYPMLVRAVRWGTGLSLQAAGLVVSHVLLFGALWLLAFYVRQRLPDAPPRLRCLALLALGLFPTGVFLRAAYTESLFLFLCLAAMLGMERRWPLVAVAGIVGAVTAARPVGVAMLLPLGQYVWTTSCSWRQAACRMLRVGPLAVWGLAAYMAYQAWAFGEPLAFAKTQAHWRMRLAASCPETLLALASWEPIWSVYLPGAPGYWRKIDPGVPLALSYQSANCVLFVGSVVLVVVGGAKKWLTGREVALAGCLLAIPYVLAAYRFCMVSQGRYVSVVFPIYLVLGQLLWRMPRVAAMGALMVSAFYLMAFAAMLAAGYLVG